MHWDHEPRRWVHRRESVLAKSARGLAQSKTWRLFGRFMESLLSFFRMHWDHEPRRWVHRRESVLDCGSPLPLLRLQTRSKSARGLAQSKTWRLFGRFMERTAKGFPCVPLRALGARPQAPSIEPLHPDVFVADDAFWIMRLQGEAALIQFAGKLFAGLSSGRLGVFQDGLSINLHRHLVVLHDDVLRPPLVVLRRSGSDVYNIIQAAGFLPIPVAHVHLTFKTVLRPIGFLIFRVKINAAVRARLRHDVHLQFEVFERFLVADIKQMIARTVGDERALLDFPGAWAFGGRLPAVEGFAIENAHESFLGVSRAEAGDGNVQKNAGGNNCGFHGTKATGTVREQQGNMAGEPAPCGSFPF